MLEPIRRLVLRLFRVPPEPAIPAGARVIRVFRAAPNYYRYKLVLWGIKQIGFLVTLVAVVLGAGAIAAEPASSAQLAILRGVQSLAVAVFLVQLPISFGVMRLGYELRWYILMDRSLRIREGVIAIQEKTMTFANIQQISIERNPLQRLLGLADVHVRTAGGGASTGGGGAGGQVGEGMHEAFFRGVDNAEEIRTAIRERVRLHRGTGLGDPDDRGAAALAAEPRATAALPGPAVTAGAAPARPGVVVATAAAGEGTDALLAAARELRDEVRAWRAARRPLPPASPDPRSS